MPSLRPPRREHAAVLVRQIDGSVWRPDAALTISFRPNYTITEHPVESGAAISDHIQPRPNTIVVNAVVTENPTLAPGQLGGPIHLRRQLKWLYETAENGQLVDIVTRRLGIFKRYAITGLPHIIDKVARLNFQITLRQVRIATATSVFITVEQVTHTDTTSGGEITEDDAAAAAGAPDEVDVGEQATTDTDGTEAEEEDQSTLASLLDAL